VALLALLPRVGEGLAMTRNILGVDIGSKGAMALLSPDGELVEVINMPTLVDGPARHPPSTPRSKRRASSSPRTAQ